MLESANAASQNGVAEDGVAEDGAANPEDLFGRLLATRGDLYRLLQEMIAQDLPPATVGSRLLDATVKLDACLVQLTERLSTLTSLQERVRLLTDDLLDARGRFLAVAAPALMHPPIHLRVAPPLILDPDPDDERSRAAVMRVVNAYHRAMEDVQNPSRSIWDVVEGQNQALLTAVQERDIETVRETLARMFQTNLVWGLGRVHESMPRELRELPSRSGPQIHITDALVSLAEATGATRITNIEQQGIESHIRALEVDLDRLLVAVEERTGLDLSFPSVGAAYGCQVAGRFVSIDSLIHSYVVYQLRHLGAEGSSKIVEIGGGYGCLASMFCRNGFSDYTIVDLPWVNLLQGYFLIMALPLDTVSLYGEPERSLKVLPFWTFGDLADGSVDYVLNTDSLPEIGAETALQYLVDIARVVRRLFFSINQEARTRNVDTLRQNCVAELAAAAGGLRLLHRHRAWMRQGYVEEIYVPA